MPLLDLPSRIPDLAIDLPTLPQAALFYRLNGDDNPLHIEPAVATGAGFERPILHGLCTYGMACHALLKAVCDYDPARIAGLRVRFSAPVYPGETIRTEIWRSSPKEVLFRCRVIEREVIVINAGQLRLR
ncbi:MaoC family dehydratase [Bradyrhizobium sp. AS23.2]|uniref:MaoC family dehydratase n=1 Tax=Bradyrhizobium sp. AS23.2 TaxID=1680155 RepID=UPI001FDA81A1|nr:MaoC family dehydratase [Bradyrhizobium sp. AS23.2]